MRLDRIAGRKGEFRLDPEGPGHRFRRVHQSARYGYRDQGNCRDAAAPVLKPQVLAAALR